MEEERFKARTIYYSFNKEFVPELPLAIFSIGVSLKCHGYGKMLIEKSAEEAKKINLKGLMGVVDLGKNNPFDLTKWYLRRGFKIIGHSTAKAYTTDDTGFPLIYLSLV